MHPFNIAKWTVRVDSRADGALLVEPETPLGPYPARLTDSLDTWAELQPDQIFLAQRQGGREWRTTTYAEFRRQARSAAQQLLLMGLNLERPLAILSGNDIEHAVLGVASMYAGIPYAPISTAWSIVSKDHSRLRDAMNVLTPGAVFAADGGKFAGAISAAVPPETPLIVTSDPPLNRPTSFFGDLVGAQVNPEPGALPDVASESIAKILFTSGSSGVPKGVLTTHGMLTSNQEMLRTVFPFLREKPMVICDWLPWNHTFGGSHNFGLVLYNGGTLYIDDGKPVEGAFEETLRNLREIAPTAYFNVPKGYEMLAAALRRDGQLRRHFYSRLQMTFYAAAGLSQDLWDEFDRLAIETTGTRIPMLTGLGATETAPFALCASPENTRAGVIGVPVPGVRLKLVPTNGKLEARVKGPNVTPGYLQRPDLTRAAFDDEGYYCLGDAIRFVDPEDPNRGFVFDGRLTEDFKLATGTWVSVGPVRARLLAHFAPYFRDAVIAGHERGELTALLFPEPETYARLLATGTARSFVEDLLTGFAAASTGSSTRIARALVLDTPASLDGGEITDKGTINQSAVLRRRADRVEELYSRPFSPHVWSVHIDPAA